MTKAKDRLIFVTDGEAKTQDWLREYFEQRNFSTDAIGMNSSKKNRTVSWRRIILFYKYIQTAIREIRKSNADDIIINWNFIIGAFAAFFCKILGIKRTILSLNMISHEKGLFNKIVRKIVYNTVFKYPGFYITVNSKELVDSYRSEFAIKQDHFFILSDCIRAHYERADYIKGDGSVFCGGEAKRDWNTLFKAAELLPDVPFTIIARKIHFDSSLAIPKNVKAHFDTDFDFFYGSLKASSIVALPLTTTAPAGLIVLLRSVLLSKPIIITSTSSSRNYVEDNKNGILLEKGDHKKLADSIALLLANDNMRESFCANMNETIKRFSVEHYHKTLENILVKIKAS